MHVRVVRFMGGCAFWSKRVVLGVVRRLCAHCPGIPPFRNTRRRHALQFLLNIPSDSLLRPSTPCHFPLLPPITPEDSLSSTTTTHYSLLLCAGLCAGGCAQGCAQGLGCTTCTRVVRFFFHCFFFLLNIVYIYIYMYVCAVCLPRPHSMSLYSLF